MHILGQKFISISLGLSQKKEIEKWLLIEHRVSVYKSNISFSVGYHDNRNNVLNLYLRTTLKSQQQRINGMKFCEIPLSGDGGNV